MYISMACTNKLTMHAQCYITYSYIACINSSLDVIDILNFIGLTLLLGRAKKYFCYQLQWTMIEMCMVDSIVVIQKKKKRMPLALYYELVAK